MARQKQTAFRLTPELLARLDKYAEHMSRETPGVEFNRTDAVRSILTRVLDEHEAKERKASKR